MGDTSTRKRTSVHFEGNMNDKPMDLGISNFRTNNPFDWFYTSRVLTRSPTKFHVGFTLRLDHLWGPSEVWSKSRQFSELLCNHGIHTLWLFNMAMV